MNLSPHCLSWARGRGRLRWRPCPKQLFLLPLLLIVVVRKLDCISLVYVYWDLFAGTHLVCLWWWWGTRRAVCRSLAFKKKKFLHTRVRNSKIDSSRHFNAELVSNGERRLQATPPSKERCCSTAAGAAPISIVATHNQTGGVPASLPLLLCVPALLMLMHCIHVSIHTLGPQGSICLSRNF